MKLTNVLGVQFVNGTIIEAVEKALRLAREHSSAYIIAPDSELMLAAQKDRYLMSAIKEAAMCLPESSGIIHSSEVLGYPIKNKICALDFASALMARMSEEGMSIFVLGNDTETVENACFNITSRYPGIKLAGSDDGYFAMEQDLFDVINEAKPDLVLVGYGSPEQEKWMHSRKNSVDTGIMLGFGRELSIMAGLQERAPMRWRDSGFEWLYWLSRDPKRVGRMIKSSRLVLNAAWRRIFN